MARVVFDPLAEAHLLHHLDVVVGAHPQPLGLDQLAFLLELSDPPVGFLADLDDRLLHLVRRRDELLGREKGVLVDLVDDLAGQRVHRADAIDLVAEELDPHGGLIEVGRMHLDHVAAHPELAAAEGDVVPFEEDRHQRLQEIVAPDLLADPGRDHHPLVVIGRAQAVDARHRGDHHGVFAGQQRAHGREAQAFDLVVDRRILLDVGVGPRDVGLRLIVVEVADEVLDRVVREEVLELRVELRRERLVVAHDQRRPADLLDDVRHCEGLPRARHAEQRLVHVPGADRLHQLGNRLGLVAFGGIVAGELERHPRRGVIADSRAGKGCAAAK